MLDCGYGENSPFPPGNLVFFRLTDARVARETLRFRGSQTVIKQCGHNRFNYAGVVGHPRPSSRDGSSPTK